MDTSFAGAGPALIRQRSRLTYAYRPISDGFLVQRRRGLRYQRGEHLREVSCSIGGFVRGRTRACLASARTRATERPDARHTEQPDLHCRVRPGRAAVGRADRRLGERLLLDLPRHSG